MVAHAQQGRGGWLFCLAKDSPIQHFSSESSDDPTVFSAMDDSTWDRVLDLSSHSYEIILDKAAPNIAHWRFGFKLSKDNNFPIGRGFRTSVGYPLFHIGKHHEDHFGIGPKPDTDNIRVTLYGIDGQIISNNTSANNIAFIPSQNNKIKILVAYKNGEVSIELFDGSNSKALLNNLPFDGYNKCKLYAWADNQSLNNNAKYEFEIQIKEI